MKTYKEIIESPIGNILLEASEEGLTSVTLTDNIHLLAKESHDHIVTAKCQFSEYFKGLRDDFDIPLVTEDYPPFYQKVWQALLDIPYGQTRSYLDIAVQLGDPKSVRAVGMANGKNPLAIIIPCHRIIGKSGKLVGYAWGLESKKWLLRHELAHSPVPEHMLF